MAARALRTIRLPVITSLSILLILILFASSAPFTVQASSPNVVISQVYGGGGATSGSPTYKVDYIELFNRGTSPVDIQGWSLQYGAAGSSSSPGIFGGSTGLNIIRIANSTIIPAGKYYLIQTGAVGTAGAPFPVTADLTSSVINMSGSAGKMALVSNGTWLNCNTWSACAGKPVVDLVAYGQSFNAGEGNTTVNNNVNVTTAQGGVRKGSGCTDTDNNNADFDVVTGPIPRYSGSLPFACPTSTNPSGTGAASPTVVDQGSNVLLTVNVTPGANPTSTGLTVSGNLSTIGGSAAQTFYNDGTHGDVTAGDSVFSFQATVGAATPWGNKTLPITISDLQLRTGSTSITLKVAVANVPIRNIQGAGHLSPMAGQIVSTVPSIITGKSNTGFYIQDPNPDNNVATSEGIFVYTSSTPSVNVGDKVIVSGTVSEYRQSGSTSTNLTLTELSSLLIRPISTGNPLPAPVLIGNGGRLPPTTIIEDDAVGGNVENAGSTFDPASDGLDFYESLEGMRVQVNDALVVGPRADFGSNREVYVVANNGARTELRTSRSGLLIRPGDFNPERIVLNDLTAAGGGPTLPAVNVRDQFPGATIGVMDYNYGNFKLEVTQLPAVVSGGLNRETVGAMGASQVALATFNVENLAPGDPPAKFSRLAGLIVNNLRSPDLIAVEEVQDDNGTPVVPSGQNCTPDGVVSASTTWSMLIASIKTAGGPTYNYQQIDPVDDADGGAPCGNIRQGFLYRTDRGLAFVSRSGGTATTATTVGGAAGAPQLSYSPGRIDPTNTAFNDSRKPLAGEFTFNGHRLFVIANHFNSKSGDHALFGRYQPPVFSSEGQRTQQAMIVRDFVSSILSKDSNAEVVVLGDLNDFEFSAPLTTLKGNILKDLIETLPPKERYTYVYQGNSEALDHVLLSNALFSRAHVYKVVHVNAEFADQASDHDPQSVYLTMPKGQTKTK